MMVASWVLLSIWSNCGVALAMVRPPSPSLGSVLVQLISDPGPYALPENLNYTPLSCERSTE